MYAYRKNNTFERLWNDVERNFKTVMERLVEGGIYENPAPVVYVLDRIELHRHDYRDHVVFRHLSKPYVHKIPLILFFDDGALERFIASGGE